jgi:hypothetical protein
VISDSYFRGTRNGGWTQQRGALMTPAARSVNTDAIAKLSKGLPFVPDRSYVSSEKAQQHQVALGVPLRKIVDMLLEYVVEDPRDTAATVGLLITLKAVVEATPKITAAVYRMRPHAAHAERSVSPEGTLEDGFQQGRTRTAGGGVTYPGDAFFHAPGQLSIQLHSYDLKQGTRVVAKAAPLIAIHIPRELAQEWLVQVQAGQKTS